MYNVFGWKTTQPVNQGVCNGTNSGTSARVIELQGAALYGYTPNDGTTYVELNAYNAGMLYQSLCLASGDTFNFSFAHRPIGNRTDVAEFRLGIPSGLDAGVMGPFGRRRSRAVDWTGFGIVSGKQPMPSIVFLTLP